MPDVSQDKPDLTNGIPEGDLADGAMLVGQVGDEAVLLARRGQEIFAIGATCTHYGGPLGEGLIVEDTVRCPWHHACFSLRTGEALAAPALNATSCWRTERRDGRIFVGDRISEAGRQLPAKPRPTDGPRERMVIIGGGGAGNAAAEMLRRGGYAGGVTIISDDAAAPYDRPNLSKDYLAGTAPEEWIPLRPPEFYADNGIELRLGTTATAIDTARRHVMLGGGEELGFDKLLLATGAEPIRLQVPGADLPHVRTLRSLADSRDLIARARRGTHAVVVGASFIGLEAAAALRHRQVEVHVVAPEARPMERVLGPELGDFVRQLHESHGVVFHLGHTVGAIEAGRVRLDNGVPIDADLVVVGIGVRPRIHLAQQAGLAIDRGVLVNEYLETSAQDFRRRRHRPLARRLQRRAAAHRALGRCRAARPDRGAQHARPARALRRRAVLLEPALRRVDRLRRPCQCMGRDCRGRRSECPRRSASLPPSRPHPGRRDDLPRPREPIGGGRHGTRPVAVGSRKGSAGAH